MKDTLSKQSLFFLSIALLLLCSHLYFSYLPQLNELETEGKYLAVFIILLTLMVGSRWGLMTTLVVLFTIGSLYFWNLFLQPQGSSFLFSEFDLLIFGSGLVLLTVLCGYIHDYSAQLLSELKSAQSRVKTLVSIDPETGFDNRDRMILEIDAEIGRTKRYGGLFTIILYKIDYLEEFKNMYGNKEYNRLLETFLADIQQMTRTTDKKFRVEQDTFGILLPYTPEENIGIIYERFTQLLQDYQTEKGKTLSFSSHVAHITVKGQEEERQAEELLTLLGNELKVNAL